jgi:predicted nucleic acid-binding protein
LTVYLDTSVLVGLFVAHDGFAARAQALAETPGFAPIVSDFVSTEFASVIARLTRMSSLHPDGAREIFAEFDAWAAARADLAEVAAIDVQTAEGFIRRLDLSIRAPDAINLAIASRLGAPIATFDQGMAACATTLGIALQPL